MLLTTRPHWSFQTLEYGSLLGVPTPGKKDTQWKDTKDRVVTIGMTSSVIFLFGDACLGVS